MLSLLAWELRVLSSLLPSPVPFAPLPGCHGMPNLTQRPRCRTYQGAASSCSSIVSLGANGRYHQA